MPQISNKKKQKIQEQIIFYLFNSFPNPKFITDIAKELARDEEFIKTLVFDLLKKELLIRINKNPKGIKYKKRLRWRLSNKVQEAYAKQQKQTLNHN